DLVSPVLDRFDQRRVLLRLGALAKYGGEESRRLARPFRVLLEEVEELLARGGEQARDEVLPSCRRHTRRPHSTCYGRVTAPVKVPTVTRRRGLASIARRASRGDRRRLELRPHGRRGRERGRTH